MNINNHLDAGNNQDLKCRREDRAGEGGESVGSDRVKNPQMTFFSPEPVTEKAKDESETPGSRNRILEQTYLGGLLCALRVRRKGNRYVSLRWDPPVERDSILHYQVERRERPRGEWTRVCLSEGTEITFSEDEKDKDLEYRVIAVNKESR